MSIQNLTTFGKFMPFWKSATPVKEFFCHKMANANVFVLRCLKIARNGEMMGNISEAFRFL